MSLRPARLDNGPSVAARHETPACERGAGIAKDVAGGYPITYLLPRALIRPGRHPPSLVSRGGAYTHQAGRQLIGPPAQR